MKNKIEAMMAQLNMEQDISILKDVFTNHNLKDYFNAFIVGKFNTLEEALTKDCFVFKAKTILLLYEGACFHNLNTAETKQLLLYGLFRLDHLTRKGQLPAVEHLFDVHASIPEKKQTTETNIDIVEELLAKDIARNRTDKANIIKDTEHMGLYIEDNFTKKSLENVIEERMNNGMLGGYSYESSVDYIHDKLLIPKWITRWAKMKAFNRNWPKMVAQSRKKFKELDTVS